MTVAQTAREDEKNLLPVFLSPTDITTNLACVEDDLKSSEEMAIRKKRCQLAMLSFFCGAIWLMVLFVPYVLLLQSPDEAHVESPKREWGTPETGLDEFGSWDVGINVHGWTRADCAANANWTMTRFPMPPYPNHTVQYASASFALPLTLEVLHLVGRGSLARGTVHITDTGVASSGEVIFNVEIGFLHNKTFDETTVCLMRPRQNRYGVGIFSPPGLDSPEYAGSFTIDVQIPPGPSRDSPSLVKQLELDMPQFEIKVDHLQDTVLFDTISLSTSNKPIIADSLAARRATLRTSQAEIEGRFNISSSLSLITSRAPIRADTQLRNSGSLQDGATALWARTSFPGPLDLTAELISPPSIPGTFQIDARASESPLTIRTFVAPPPSPPPSQPAPFPGPFPPARPPFLALTALTSGAPASVALHPGWEGTFALRSSEVAPSLEYDPAAPDPSGRGRTRKVQIVREREGELGGYVEWAPGGQGDAGGRVVVGTMRGPVALRF
ncbi:hypothetical protein CERSUDRAFT_98849 [Gelatoporia subvermispora B]|uniref:Uncharacterized protein n=1 Tax=Ceriporiopsis subvermispora (strain B) TaxID=914234 RepID=M2PC55_CERS8|nr:hypothetical protein CERSUDRAFT_98849 [Gelatoporia subvermispora B]